MNDFVSTFISLVNGIKLITLVLLIGIDTLLGIALAIKKKTFKWSEMARFLNTDVLQLVGGYFIVGVIAVAEPKFGLVVPATWVLIDTKLIADIINKLKAFGVPIS